MFGFAFSGPGDLATWVSVVFTLIAGASAAIAFVMLRRRERRQALTDLHASLTSGETARARNTIGTLLYSNEAGDQPTRTESIEAYFALIWALQRARNVFRTYSLYWRALDAPQSRLHSIAPSRSSDASLALTWNLTEIAENVVQFHDLYSAKWAIEDEDAWDDIGTYVNAERLGRSTARR
ncbi:hypothetical protein [Microbacterium candidum]|uniref:DUF4760 domain-containing protein n=1 Tax=Microbacterium candidum TaxID=3041922 RepID=A0ABT7MVY5_9MICO|nr:hypothetical protein [Microbacterium sp. ASV49]MDL9978602.1 hypothetical protein [Microbacterium sp. ASV49]